MGIETALIIGATLLQAKGQMDAAKDQAKATVREANLVSENKAKETVLKAARLQSSFLSSGLTLEGTPMSVIDDTFNVGIADLNQIKDNANIQSKNLISQGRTQALSTIAGGFSGMDFGSLGFGSGGFTVPGTGSSTTFSPNGVPIPGNKPTRINWG